MSEPKKKMNAWVTVGAGLGLLAVAYGGSMLIENSRVGAAGPVTVEVLERVAKPGTASARAAALPVPAVAARPSVAVGSAEDLARRYQVPVSASQASQGPSDALLTLVMWCDFRSAACRAADKAVKELISKKPYQGQMRWVYRHLPVSAADPDVAAHVFAQAAFRRANKFWEVRDKLLALPSERVVGNDEFLAIVEDVKITQDLFAKNFDKLGSYVGTDMRFAEQFGVVKPLGIFVNGRRLRPVAPDHLMPALEALLKEELKTAREAKAKHAGVGVYETLTKDGHWGIGDDPELRRQRAATQGPTPERRIPSALGAP